jgi:hypothetical protein
MHPIIPAPPAESLPIEVKQYPEKTPQRNQTHIRHNRRHKTRLVDPRRDELREAVAPDVFVDGDGDHERAGHGFVRVDRVGRGHGGKRGDLDPGAGVADDD